MDPTLYPSLSSTQRLSPELEIAFQERDCQKVYTLLFGELASVNLLESVRGHAFNSITNAEDTDRPYTDLYSSLILWPIILDPRILGNIKEGEAKLTEGLTVWLAHEMQDWTDYTSTLCLLENLFSYDFIVNSSPLTMRLMLDQMALRSQIQDGPGTNAMDNLEIEVPEGAPRLYFLLGTLSRFNEWPVLRHVDHHTTYSLVRKVEGSLRVELCESKGTFGLDLHAGIPQFLDAGIVSGIAQWLTILKESYAFDGWSVETFGTDLIELSFAIDDGLGSVICVPVCKHQLGSNGVVRILEYASGLTGQLSVRAVH
jgi:hypothetical protein